MLTNFQSISISEFVLILSVHVARAFPFFSPFKLKQILRYWI